MKRFLIHIIFSKIDNLDTISLSFKDSQISDSSIILLFEELMNKISHLTNLSLSFSKTKISSRGMKALINHTRKFMDNLVEFGLCLDSTDLIDEDIIPIFQPMPKLEFFLLSLGNNKITNNAIKILTNKFREMKNLKEVHIGLSRTDVAIESISFLIQNLKKAEALYFSLIGIKINDEFIIELDKTIRSGMKNLKAFRLYLEQDLGQNG